MSRRRVGCIRVTHPCATRHRLRLLATVLPYDLHVLGLPLAFILSQDQTLHCISLFLDYSSRFTFHSEIIRILAPATSFLSIFSKNFPFTLGVQIYIFFLNSTLFLKFFWHFLKDYSFSYNKKKPGVLCLAMIYWRRPTFPSGDGQYHWC